MLPVKPAIVKYNGVKCGYLQNLQSDIVGIVDSSGSEVVKYIYDPWGNILSTSGSMASTLGTIQPFRYRGYVYDEETGLYYLRSRYYNPQKNRFINLDIIIRGNLFAYCQQNPVVYNDKDGNNGWNRHRRITWNNINNPPCACVSKCKSTSYYKRAVFIGDAVDW